MILTTGAQSTFSENFDLAEHDGYSEEANSEEVSGEEASAKEAGSP
ncbi:hypothetical protein [cf. Phormidesmis sp. LEGE 11477]|nr:hypothetical protein [cf. Phormidesmis sp. LEGE 11477]MBE9060439.1 hypothetical protein [cf. Phormidesmis sp. LEGE 11477]